jgi:hypothetical protein
MVTQTAHALEQAILCPGCNGKGWHRFKGRNELVASACPVCEARGFLIIDAERTFSLPTMKPPSVGSPE